MTDVVTIGSDDDYEEDCHFVEMLPSNFNINKNGITEPEILNKEVDVKIIWLFETVKKYKIRRVSVVVTS